MSQDSGKGAICDKESGDAQDDSNEAGREGAARRRLCRGGGRSLEDAGTDRCAEEEAKRASIFLRAIQALLQGFKKGWSAYFLLKLFQACLCVFSLRLLLPPRVRACNSVIRAALHLLVLEGETEELAREKRIMHVPVLNNFPAMIRVTLWQLLFAAAGNASK